MRGADFDMEYKGPSAKEIYSERLRTTIALSVGLALCLALFISSASALLQMNDGNRSRMERLRREYVPAVTRDFEHSRARLDLLRNGEFAAIHGRAGIYWIQYGNEGRPGPERQRVSFEDLHSIEALPQEERDAIAFLILGKELERSFNSVSQTAAVLHSSTGGGLSERVIILYPGESMWQLMHPYYYYSVDLGYGYTLWVYADGFMTGLGSGIFAIVWLMLLVLVLLLGAATVILLVFLRLTIKKLRAYKSSSEHLTS